MIRCALPPLVTAEGATALCTPHRSIRVSSIQETLKPLPGRTAGQLSLLNEICCNPDAEEERRKPIFRHEVVPTYASGEEPPYLRAMCQWGYDSLTLFTKTNEDPGPWWNANASTMTSTWSQVGDYANAGMWSGVWRYTYGVGEYNMRPFDVRGRAWGRKDKHSGALAIRYGKATGPLQRLQFPHTKEHEKHRRVKNPMNNGFQELDALHGKRILRELQHHLGQGLRFYLVDGVLGSAPRTATPYRIITDNPTHAYFASLAAIRKFNYVARQEVSLVKRLTQSPIDEWGWRRPGVLVYHAPGYDFEAPRIVEEFGGPRPADMGLRGNRFIALEPYSIPMKAMMSAEPSCDTLLDVTAFLAARWGFYADDRSMLTLPSNSVMSPDGSRLALVIDASADIGDSLRVSPHLYGARHHRISENIVSRAWDVNSVPRSCAPSPSRAALIEEDLGRVHEPLPTRFGLPDALSHRLFGRRNVTEFGFKWPHSYTADPGSKAHAAGHLFKAPVKSTLAGHQPRPSQFALQCVDVVVVGDGKDAADAILGVLRHTSFVYAEEAPLMEAIADFLSAAGSVRVVPPATAKPLLEKVAKTGMV